MRTVLAVDLGGTKTAVARVDADGTMHDRATFPAVRSVEASAGQIASRCGGVDAVGIVVPGIFTPDTGCAWCPNLWGAREVPLATSCSARSARDRTARPPPGCRS